MQLAALLVLGVVTVARFPVWALVDEAAHYEYVQWFAEDGRLPMLDEDHVHPEVLAIDDGTYPAPAKVAAAERGLFGRSYGGVTDVAARRCVMPQDPYACFSPGADVSQVARSDAGRHRLDRGARPRAGAALALALWRAHSRSCRTAGSWPSAR